MHRLGAATVVHTVAGRGSVGNLLDAKTASQETSIEPRLAALAAKTARLVNAVIDESQDLNNQIKDQDAIIEQLKNNEFNKDK